MGVVPAPTAPLHERIELISDLCRFAEGLVTEAAVRKRWRLEEKDWIALNDDEVVRAVDEERVRRVRNGAFKRERAQQLITKGPDVLDKILSSERSNPRHVIDAVKALDGLAGFTPERSVADVDRVVIRIDLGADVRAQGLASDPSDLIEIEATARPVDGEGRFIDAAPQERAPLIEASEEPVKRGRGRPPGSKSKPKVDDRQKCLGFDV